MKRQRAQKLSAAASVQEEPHRSRGKRPRSLLTTSPGRQRLEEPTVLLPTGMKAMPERDSGGSVTNSDDDDESHTQHDLPPPLPLEPVPIEFQCRYPNKPCPQPRATKKHGDLHSYCPYHRHKAQQYQRKLEQKKRERRLVEEKSPRVLPAATPTINGMDTRRKHQMASSHNSWRPQRTAAVQIAPVTTRRSFYTRSRPRHVDAPTPIESSQQSVHVNVALEPFHHPVTLQQSDIQLLQVFLMDSPPSPKSDSSSSTQAGSAARSRGRVMNDSSNRTLDTDERAGAYTIDLDGFAFTSEAM